MEEGVGINVDLSNKIFFHKIFDVFDRISLWSGKAIGWLIIPMMLGLTYEVIKRYVLNAPTVWAYDLTFMLYGTHFMIGAAYTLLKKGHVRTEFIYGGLKPKWQGLIDSIFYILCYFPGLIIFFLVSYKYAYNSWLLKERIVTSPWMPAIYPLKIMMALGILLLLIQGLSELRKSIYAFYHNELFPEDIERAGEGYDI
jgi:TRAP-type mannitol/chloroaromatic compound transport system permease small subunit